MATSGFKTYDPITQLVAGNGGYQVKKNTAIPGNIAIFGNNLNAGQTIDSGISKTDAIIGSNNLFSSSKTMSEIRQAFYSIYQTSVVVLPVATELKLFANDNFDEIGPSTVSSTDTSPFDQTTFDVDINGNITIICPSTSLVQRTYNITYYSGGMNDSISQNTAGSVEICFYDEITNGRIGLVELLRCLDTVSYPQFTNNIVCTMMVNVQPGESYSFSVRAKHVDGPNPLRIGPNADTNTLIGFSMSKLTIERVC